MTTDFDPLKTRLSPAAILLTEPFQFTPYTKDTTETIGTCLAAVECATRNDVITTVTFCHERGISMTPRGAGTGLSGGATPQGGVVISTTRMNRITIDPGTQRARCGPGAITKSIQDEAARYCLTYPPDPASYAESTIAGNIAENAGGLRCKRFGVTRDYVTGLEAILPNGQILRTGTLAESRGMNWTDILTSSEGTLGIITDCELQLIPTVPLGSTILAFFPTVFAAGEAVARIVDVGIIPTVLEFMDGFAVDVALSSQANTTDYPPPSPILLIASNASYDPHQTKTIIQICKKSGAHHVRNENDAGRSESLWLLRRSLSRAVKTKAAYWLSEDVAVPVSRFAELVQAASNLKILPHLDVVCFGHAGDGNLHAVFMLPIDSPEYRRLVETQVAKLMEITLAMRGTTTGEHGTGLAKREFLRYEFDSATVGAMRVFKDIIDPRSQVNPGKIF